MVRGKSYPAIVRLCQIAADRWPEVTSAYYQINLLKQPLWKFISLIFGWCVERVAYDKLDEWIADLNDLLEWQDADSPEAENLESDSFMNMMAKGGGG